MARPRRTPVQTAVKRAASPLIARGRPIQVPEEISPTSFISRFVPSGEIGALLQPPAGDDASDDASGGGGGGAASSGLTGIFDWHSLLGIYDLPGDLIAGIQSIFADSDDLGVAVGRAIAYVRGSPWYANTFPGIIEGFRLGLIRDERDYRFYVNQIDQLYRRFYGRSVSAGEVANYIRQGFSFDVVGKKLAGESFAKTYAPDLQYLSGAFTSEGRLSEQDLQAYGEQQVGLESSLGSLLDRRLREASQRVRRAFEGVLAQPSLSIGGQGLYSPSLGGGRKPDIAA